METPDSCRSPSVSLSKDIRSCILTDDECKFMAVSSSHSTVSTATTACLTHYRDNSCKGSFWNTEPSFSKCTGAQTAEAFSSREGRRNSMPSRLLYPKIDEDETNCVEYSTLDPKRYHSDRSAETTDETREISSSSQGISTFYLSALEEVTLTEEEEEGEPLWTRTIRGDRAPSESHEHEGVNQNDVSSDSVLELSSYAIVENEGDTNPTRTTGKVKKKISGFYLSALEAVASAEKSMEELNCEEDYGEGIDNRHYCSPNLSSSYSVSASIVTPSKRLVRSRDRDQCLRNVSCQRDPDKAHRSHQDRLSYEEAEDLRLALELSLHEAVSSMKYTTVMLPSPCSTSNDERCNSLDINKNSFHSNSSDLLEYDGNDNGNDYDDAFLMSQSQAMEEFQNNRNINNRRFLDVGRLSPQVSHGFRRFTAPAKSIAHSSPCSDSGVKDEALEEGRRSFEKPKRQSLFEARGEIETRKAISKGTSRAVKCQGCKARLLTPIHYSLVFCPKCRIVSPA